MSSPVSVKRAWRAPTTTSFESWNHGCRACPLVQPAPCRPTMWDSSVFLAPSPILYKLPWCLIFFLPISCVQGSAKPTLVSDNMAVPTSIHKRLGSNQGSSRTQSAPSSRAGQSAGSTVFSRLGYQSKTPRNDALNPSKSERKISRYFKPIKQSTH